MTDGRHEDPTGRNGWAPVVAQVKYRGKALAAAVGALAAQEAVLALTDHTLQEQVQAAVPGYAFLVPVLFSALVGVLTHQVPRGPKPNTQPADSEDPPADAGR